MGCRQGGKRRQKGEEIISSKFLIPQPSSGYRAYHVHRVRRNGVGYNQEERRKTYFMKIKKGDVGGMILRYIHRKRGKKEQRCNEEETGNRRKKRFITLLSLSLLCGCAVGIGFTKWLWRTKKKGFKTAKLRRIRLGTRFLQMSRFLCETHVASLSR